MTNTAYAAGSTGVTVEVRGFTASTGLPYTAGAYNTSGITAQYTRNRAAAVSITLATQTAAGAWSSGGFVHIAGGLYRLDVPDAAFLTGADDVCIIVSGITDVVFTVARVEIVGADPRAATVAANVTQIAGQTASAAGTVTFPGTVASSTNITAASGVTLAAVTHTGATIPTVTTTGTATNVTTVNGLASGVITAASIASDAITSAKIADNALTAAKIAAGAITSGKVATDAIGAAQLAADASTEIAAAVLSAATTTPIAANVKKMNDATVNGNGTSGNLWRGA